MKSTKTLLTKFIKTAKCSFIRQSLCDKIPASAQLHEKWSNLSKILMHSIVSEYSALELRRGPLLIFSHRITEGFR